MDIDSSLAFEASGNHPPNPQFCSEDQHSYGVSTDVPSFPAPSATVTNEAGHQLACELYDEDGEEEDYDDGFGIAGSLSHHQESLEPIPMETESASSEYILLYTPDGRVA